MRVLTAKHNGQDDWILTVYNRFTIEVEAEVYKEVGSWNVGLISKGFNDVNVDRIKDAIMVYVSENESEFEWKFQDSAENDHRFRNGLIDNY